MLLMNSMSYSTFCVHRGGNIINSPRNIGLIRLTPCSMMVWTSRGGWRRSCCASGVLRHPEGARGQLAVSAVRPRHQARVHPLSHRRRRHEEHQVRHRSRKLSDLSRYCTTQFCKIYVRYFGSDFVSYCMRRIVRMFLLTLITTWCN